MNKTVANLHEVSLQAKNELADLPLFILGHSMGSMLARTYAIRFGADLSGLILSGTMNPETAMLRAGIFISRIIKARKGDRYRSNLHKKLGHGKYRKAMKLKIDRTVFDWLSRDEKVVDDYIADPKCGILSTVGFYLDFFNGILYVKNKRKTAKIPKDLPILIFGGDRDPVGKFGFDLKRVQQIYDRAGLKNTTLITYSKGRHEMLNEINKEDVYNDVLSWIKEHLPAIQ